MAVALYWPALWAGFLSDDFELVSAVRSSGPFGLWTYHAGGFFRPLVSLSLWLDNYIYGLDALGWHVSNLVFHIACALLVSALARSIRGFEAGESLLAGLLFLVLACHVEPVSWVAGRCDLIATFGMLCSLWAYLRYRKHAGARWLVLSLVAQTVAFGAKESAVSLFFILLSFELLQRMARRPSNAWALVSHAALLFIYLIVRGFAVGGAGPSSYVSALFPSHRMLVNIFLAPVRCISPEPSCNALVLVVVLLVCGQVVRQMLDRRERDESRVHSLLLLVLCYLCAMLPVVALYISAVDSQNERLIYFPSVFLVMGTVLIVGLVFPRRNSRIVFVMLLVQSVFCLVGSAKWFQAGVLAESVICGVARHIDPSHPVMICNVPDNYRGAYVLRNSLQYALALRGLKGEVCAVLYQSLDSGAHGVEEPTPVGSLIPGKTSRAGSLTLCTTSVLSPFMYANGPIESLFSTPWYRVQDYTEHRAVVIPLQGSEYCWLYFQGGRLHEVQRRME